MSCTLGSSPERNHTHPEEGERIVHRVDPASSEQMDAFVDAIGEGPLAGMIHLAPLRLASMAWSEESGPSQQVVLSVKRGLAS